MTIENLLISKNRSEFDKIISFLKTIVIKNEVEGDEVETTTTAIAYEDYKSALLGHDTSLSYQFSQEMLEEFGFIEDRAKRYYFNPKQFQTDYMRGNALCKAFLNTLRKQRYSSYIESNPYYRQFCGLPYDDSQIIWIKNTDKVSDSDPDEIYLHNVNSKDYPKTYSRLFYDRDFDSILNEYDYLYLKFIENPMTPYEIREADQFDIVYCDKSLLSETELQYWFECYNIAKNEIMRIDYIQNFQATYKAYVNVMYLFILSYAFNIYCAKLLEKYSVRDYTDAEIYDILDSNNLSNLKGLNIALLRRVVKRLPDLKVYTGTNKIIEILFDIVADQSLSVKRYYLTKKYTIDSEGNTTIDKKNLYSKSVDLTFKEKTVIQGELSGINTDEEFEYGPFTMSDDLWGGTTSIKGDDRKLAIKEEMKNIILKGEFNSIMTKYIGLTKILDVATQIQNITNKLGLLYQYCNLRGNDFAKDTIQFNGIECSPLSIFSAWCIVFGMINELDDPDHIPFDRTTVENVMKLRTKGSVSIDAEDLSNVVIDLGNGFTKTIGDFLTKEEIEKYLVGFDFTAATSIDELFYQYDENFAIIEKIRKKLETSKYTDYKVWQTIYDANMTYQTLKDLYGSYENYSDYIKQDNENIYEHIENLITSCKTPSDLYSLNTTLYNAFAEYIKEKSNNQVQYVIDESDISGGEDLSEVGVLFEQFMSEFTMLYKQDYHVSYDNAEDNVLALLYTDIVDIFKDEFTDRLEMIQKIVKDVIKDVDESQILELLYFFKDYIYVDYEFDIELIYDLYRDIIKDGPKVYLDFLYDLHKDIVQTETTENFGFTFEHSAFKEI